MRVCRSIDAHARRYMGRCVDRWTDRCAVPLPQLGRDAEEVTRRRRIHCHRLSADLQLASSWLAVSGWLNLGPCPLRLLCFRVVVVRPAVRCTCCLPPLNQQQRRRVICGGAISLHAHITTLPRRAAPPRPDRLGGWGAWQSNDQMAGSAWRCSDAGYERRAHCVHAQAPLERYRQITRLCGACCR